MKKKSILSQFTNIYNNLEEYLLIISLVCNVLLVFLQVIMRTVFKNSLTWSEELSRYIFIWQIWLGASTALKYNEHIRVTLIYSFMKSEKLKAVIGLAADFIWFLFCAYMVLNGKELLVSMVARNAASSGLQLPLVYVYMAFPIASFLVCLRLLGVLAGDWKKLTGKREEEGKLTYECTCIIRKFFCTAAVNGTDWICNWYFEFNRHLLLFGYSANYHSPEGHHGS